MEVSESIGNSFETIEESTMQLKSSVEGLLFGQASRMTGTSILGYQCLHKSQSQTVNK